MPVLGPEPWFYLEVGFVCETVIPLSDRSASCLLRYFLPTVILELLEVDSAVNLPHES